MKSTKIITFDFLRDNKLAYVKVSDSFKQNLKIEILKTYRTLSKYCQKELKISRHTLASEFRLNKYLKFDRLLKIAKDHNISNDEVYNQICAFFASGSNTSKELILNKELIIDDFFVEGYALYLAEGDTGFSGKKRPRHFRFTNANVNVINHMIKWVKTYFPDNKFYICLINPKGSEIDFESIKKLINHDEIKLKEETYNKIIKYRICLDSAILIDLILSIENKIKELCSKDKKLAVAYIKGMMIGEGTAYFNRSRYVRIEMRNEKEIKYLHLLFKLLEYECEPSLRTNRYNMWSLYIGAKQLEKFSREIGFGIHEKRQKILDKGVNKILRVNQYC
jgi:hypothetical protein